MGTPPTLTRRRVCPSPPVLGGGAHSLAREGVGESQFRRGDIHCGILYIYVLCGQTAYIESFLPIGWHTLLGWQNPPKCCTILVWIAGCWNSSIILLMSHNPKNNCWLFHIFRDRFGGKNAVCAHKTRVFFNETAQNFELFKYSRTKWQNSKPITVDVLFKAYPLDRSQSDLFWPEGTFNPWRPNLMAVPIRDINNHVVHNTSLFTNIITPMNQENQSEHRKYRTRILKKFWHLKCDFPFKIFAVLPSYSSGPAITLFPIYFNITQLCHPPLFL